MVREIKDSKKNNPIRIQDTFESKREKGWDDRFIYNKLEDNKEKMPIPKKAKNDYSSNINYIREQFGNDNMGQKKGNKKRGKSGYKFSQEKNSSNFVNSKNKIKINSNIHINNNVNNINDIGDNEGDGLSLIEDKKLRYTDNNYKIVNKINNSEDYYNNYSANMNNINKSSNNNSAYYNMSLNELEVYIGVLWNKLGVKETFQKIFHNLKEDMENDEAKKEFMIMEVDNSEKLEKFLTQLSLEIEKREKCVLLLKKITEVIEKQFIELNLDIRENLLKDLYQTIIGYRINTINVVENIALYNQYFSYAINKGKYYEEFLIRKYRLFYNENDNKNYLLKIKNDLNFLGNSKINGYKEYNINFSSNSDPFLLSMTEKVPIKMEYYLRIKQCQYIIMQEVIFDTINSGADNNINNYINESNKKKKLEPINNNSKFNNNNNTNDSSIISNNSKMIKKEKDNITCVDKKENLKSIINNNTSDKKIENYKNKINIEDDNEKHLIDKNNYDKFFGVKDSYDEQSEEQTLEELKKKLNIVKGMTKSKKEITKIKIDSNNSKFEDNNSKIENKKISNNLENKDNNEDDKVKENKENNDNNEKQENKKNIEIKKEEVKKK